ncbi:LLM class flavin-dependent oxidoreductase [Nocardioides sp. dk4132]|uniref:LLM class flavin-dependent oxidoreductase n=1 Tax=unclassified Nocardioides TaxID=2615069 RepID=UPI00129727BF|nr:MULTISPECIES: LLM class flavin-dependent oxidoreductase [unclassified Nocardioides]MQW77541.1 LLM class flavin-dependent oxidoreductase [Nocardioides sp. dk4132]QGA06075.1 LLM class flavin-dependent oxidoreductase [Nocardioides sp. dk884]
MKSPHAVRRTDCSVMYPSFPVDPVELETFSSFVRLGGLRRLYLGQTMVFEPHTTFARLIAGGSTTPLGTAVSLMPLRHPVLAALHARELALLSGTGYVAGLGLGSRAFNESVAGGWPGSPLGYVREYATIVRTLLDGQRVDLDGEHFQVHTTLEGRLEAQVEVGLGVLRPRMTALAGEVADVAISWLTPPEYCAEQLVPALERGGADREVRTRLATVVNLAVDRPGRDPVALAVAGVGNHLRAPHYGDALRRAGYDITIGDRDHNAREVVKRGLYAFGSPAEIVEQLGAYRAAGVEELLLNVGGVYNTEGPVAALRDLDDVASVLDAA